MLGNIRGLIRSRLSLGQRVQLLQTRDRVKFATRSLTGRTKANKLIDPDLAPIFVVGSNRSGASLCTQILSQHPEIEGIFQGPSQNSRINPDGHFQNNVEANHIWGILNNPHHDLTQGENVLWGLPDFISKLYIKSVSNTSKKQLIDELLAARKTDKTPLVNNNLNIFRIPLIKELFPRARFVLVTRDHRSYIESCNHKWANDRELGLFAPDSYIDHPHIGLHWLLINTIALYDLNKYAAKDHTHVKLQELHGEESARNSAITRMFTFLDLEPIESSSSPFDAGRAHVLSSNDESEDPIEMIRGIIQELISYEKSVTGAAGERAPAVSENP